MSAVDSDSLQIVQPVDPSGVIDRAAGAAPGQIVIPVYTKARSACAAAKADEIVVCAQDPEQHRLRPLPDRYEPPSKPGGQQLDLGGGVTLQQDLEQAGIGGTPSNRVMVRARIKF